MVRDPAINDAHTAQSSTREKVIEHVFLSDLLRCLWCQGARDIEVLRAEVDKGGYDVVLEANGFLRHIQLKSSHRLAKTADVGINIALARKPSGCVIWIRFDPETLALGPFLWFGGEPGAPLPLLGNQVGKHTKPNTEGQKAERPNIRVLKRGRFTVLATIADVAHALFGVSLEPAVPADGERGVASDSLAETPQQ